jgi:uncharacterized protein (TIGR04255 family)
MKRTLPRQRLQATPLVHVLAQVRFSHVFELAKRIPDIKTKLEAADFPRYQESQIQNIIVIGQGEPAAKIELAERWDFLNATKTRGVVLTPDFVLLHTNLYDTFEQFADTLQNVVDIVGAAAGAPFVERVGLRYVDLIQPRESETSGHYLKAGLVGYPVDEIPALGGTLSLSRTETRIVTKIGQLSIRCFQRNDGTFLPPDLVPTVLEYPTVLPPGVVLTILDIDHSAATGFPFNRSQIMDLFAELHDGTDIAFRGAVTPHALAVWRQEFV